MFSIVVVIKYVSESYPKTIFGIGYVLKSVEHGGKDMAKKTKHKIYAGLF